MIARRDGSSAPLQSLRWVRVRQLCVPLASKRSRESARGLQSKPLGDILFIAIHVNVDSKGGIAMESGLLIAGSGPATWVVGDLYTVKASGRETGGAFCLIEVMVPPQSGPPPHIHQREDEAFYIIEGQF